MRAARQAWDPAATRRRDRFAWLVDARGGTAIVFAVAAPILAMLTCGGVDLASLASDHSAMQDAADATALDAARQIGIGDPVGIAARATQFADAQMPGLAQRVPYTVTTTVAPDNSSVTVRIDGHRSSFFANLLPPGGWDIHTQATASNLGQTPLCVLASGATGQPAITLANQAQTTAAGCLVQSDSDITVTGSANLAAGTVQAVGSASGAITPVAQTGSPSIADPFASMAINPPLLNLCTPLPVLTAGLNILIATPTPYCGNITVRSGQTLQLSPGTYYFRNGQLQMQQDSVLTGSNVTLIFDSTAQFQFQDSSVIDLTGARSGPYAGFVIVTTRQNTGTFNISSDSARRLEGAVYIPNATLQVTGTNNQVAQQSAWTVIVARQLQLTGSPNLVINANYAGSSVPVPNGVGPTGANKVSLKR